MIYGGKLPKNFSLDKCGSFGQTGFWKKGGEKPGVSLTVGFSHIRKDSSVFNTWMQKELVFFLIDAYLKVSCPIAGEWETWEMLFSGSVCERIGSAPLCYMKELPEIWR